MTKRHFIALAELLRTLEPSMQKGYNSVFDEHGQRVAHRQWEQTRDALADFCQRYNSHFLRQRWLGYIAGECGPNGGSQK